MNDMISLITIYLGLPLMSNSSNQDAKSRRDTLAVVNLEDVQKKIHGVRTMDTFWIIESFTNHLLSSFLSILLLYCPQLMGDRQTIWAK